MHNTWFKEAVGYQIYPRSFQDSNQDGIGDLPGIIRRIPELKALGIDFIWLNPVYASPNVDNGYDISDFRAIHPDFGTMADMEELIASAHRYNIKLIMDLVVNHTSDQHPWFQEAQKSKDNPYREFYHWVDATKDTPPNDWRSFFGGSTWTYQEKTQQAYFHIFAKEQPDLNWKNETMRHEIYDMIRWWLDKGIDGFRLDAISHIQKEDWSFTITDNPWAPFMNVKGIDVYMTELKEVFDDYQCMTVGEASGVSSKKAKEWTDDTGYLDMIFELEHMVRKGKKGEERVDPFGFKQVMMRWQEDLQPIGWNALYLENHDLPRSISIFGDGSIHSAKALAMGYFFLRGTPFIYQGQELGVENYPFTSIDQVNGQDTIAFYQRLRQTESKDEALKQALNFSRDHSRTPMQWDETKYSGFSTVTPWLAVNPDYKERNQQNEANDPSSLWNFYRQMIALRKQEPALLGGEIRFLLPEHPALFVYLRQANTQQVIVCVNLTDQFIDAKLPASICKKGKCLLTNQTRYDQLQQKMTFAPFDGYVIQISD